MVVGCEADQLDGKQRRSAQVERAVAFGFEPLGNTPAQFLERYRRDYPRMAELIKASGVTAE